MSDALTVLPLDEMKRELRLDGNDADETVAAAIRAAVAFVEGLGVEVDDIASRPAIKRAVIIFAREFFIGYREIPPTHIGFAVLNVALAGC